MDHSKYSKLYEKDERKGIIHIYMCGIYGPNRDKINEVREARVKTKEIGGNTKQKYSRKYNHEAHTPWKIGLEDGNNPKSLAARRDDIKSYKSIH